MRNYEESSRIAKRIYEIAISLDKSIGEMESECGYSAGYLAKCRRGNSGLSLDAAKDFCNYLGIDYTQMLFM